MTHPTMVSLLILAGDILILTNVRIYRSLRLNVF
jgi:hypothetical protein